MAIWTSLKNIGKTGVTSVAGKPVVSSKLATALKGVDVGKVVSTGLDVYNQLKKPEGKPAYPTSSPTFSRPSDDDDEEVYDDKNPHKAFYEATWFKVGSALLGLGLLIGGVFKFFFKGKSSKRF